MKILGHRGACLDFPENTVSAFSAALEQGADGVELDVLRCRSGELVVCHDEVLSRIAGVPVEIAETPWPELSKIDVGSTLGFAPAMLPLLEEVLDLVPASKWVNVELKCDVADDRGLSAETARLLRRRGEGSRVTISSFNPGCLLRFGAVAPDYDRGLLLDPDRPLPPQLGWLDTAAQRAVHPHHSHCTPDRVRDWHRRGFRVVVWTVDDPDQARALEEAGVDAVITNAPARLRAAL